MTHARSLLSRPMMLLLNILFTCSFLAGCSDSVSAPAPTYSATIAEGRTAAKEIMDETGATAVSVALTDGNRVIWSEAFGVIDKGSGKQAGPETMFGIGSVSKMFATIATMILVDQGKISLDEPLVTYLPDFSMLSPEYRDITVRMLLNHSSGLPGGDMRNAVSVEPFTGYAAQVMEALKYQRLKHSPGYMSVYCNDGFTMLENVIAAVSGKNFPEFVQQEILTPVGMTNSRYPTARFSDGAFARAYAGDTPLDYMSFNIYATGGLFSTAEDMSRLARMFMNGGMSDSRRILSERAIAAMGEDQTLSSFNPLPSNNTRFGLGWDTVAQAGLSAVGLKGWQKGGDISGQYGATFIVADDEKLAVTVIGASNAMGSGPASKIAERVLLAALVERGRLAAVPAPLNKTVPLPVATPSGAEKAAFGGYYGSTDSLYHVTFGDDNALTLERFRNGAWEAWKQGFKLRTDGWFAADNDAITAIRFLSRAGRTYFVFRYPSGAGHYYSTLLYGQRLEDKGPLDVTWQSRLMETWLPVNDDQYSSFIDSEITPLVLNVQATLPGYLFAGAGPLADMTPQDNNRLNGMGLLIPQIFGRDMTDLAIEMWEGQQWLRSGSTLYRPLSGVTALMPGQSTATIRPAGFAQWRSLPSTGAITVSGATAWKIFGADLSLVAYGRGNGSAPLTGAGVKYLMVYGAMDSSISLNVTSP